LIDVYQQTGGAVVSVRQVPREWVSRYGIVDGEPSADDPRLYRLKRLIEKPSPDKAPTDLAIAGRYVFTPAIFDELAEQKPGVGGEIQLTDAMNALAGRPDQTMSAYRWRATRYDIGNQLDYLQCCIALGLADPRIGEKLRGFVTKVVSE
jgi:UTP--glucose-1-phosphate uridylyltransferase